MAKDAYGRIAAVYDVLVEPAARALRREGLRVCPPRDNLSILDVGCGTGTQLALYRRPGCRLCGIDLSPAMVERARRKLGDTAEVRCGDATQMDFPDGAFDLVTLVTVLHEVAPVPRKGILAECRRVVKPDGRILVLDYYGGPYSFPRGWVWKGLITALERMAGRGHYANYREFLARHAIDGLVEEARLALLERVVSGSGVAAAYVLAPGREASVAQRIGAAHVS
jgi:ubiquinone/menaquinone biosynthesis C-methylase UbiE